MASGDQIIALIKAHYNEENNQFRTLSLQIAADEAKKGHSRIAKEIKNIVTNNSKKKNIHSINNISNPKIDFLEIKHPNLKISDMILSAETEDQLFKIVNEYRHKNKLEKFGLTNRRKILLVGPPGTGKSMTSSVIASELSLPQYTIQLDKILTKFLGDTSKKIREIFEFMANNQGVYLFDEFDAIGSDRSLDHEVGEMRRILNTFLVLLENDDSNSIIISATNNPQLLDKALFRRFDEVIKYEKPTKNQLLSIFENSFDDYEISYEITQEVIGKSYGLSHAEILNVINEAIKDKILNDTVISENYLLGIIDKRNYLYKEKEA